jgi:hypothetical protein
VGFYIAVTFLYQASSTKAMKSLQKQTASFLLFTQSLREKGYAVTTMKCYGFSEK